MLLTPIVLNLFQDTPKYVYIFYHVSTLRCHSYFKSPLMEDKHPSYIANTIAAGATHQQP